MSATLCPEQKLTTGDKAAVVGATGSLFRALGRVLRTFGRLIRARPGRFLGHTVADILTQLAQYHEHLDACGQWDGLGRQLLSSSNSS